jgi:hypothetical protein
LLNDDEFVASYDRTSVVAVNVDEGTGARSGGQNVNSQYSYQSLAVIDGNPSAANSNGAEYYKDGIEAAEDALEYIDGAMQAHYVAQGSDGDQHTLRSAQPGIAPPPPLSAGEVTSDGYVAKGNQRAEDTLRSNQALYVASPADGGASSNAGSLHQLTRKQRTSIVFPAPQIAPNAAIVDGYVIRGDATAESATHDGQGLYSNDAVGDSGVSIGQPATIDDALTETKKVLKEAGIKFDSSGVFKAAGANERRRLLQSARHKLTAKQNLDAKLRNRLAAKIKALEVNYVGRSNSATESFAESNV